LQLMVMTKVASMAKATARRRLFLVGDIVISDSFEAPTLKPGLCAALETQPELFRCDLLPYDTISVPRGCKKL
jgi:hypothetical protein